MVLVLRALAATASAPARAATTMADGILDRGYAVYTVRPDGTHSRRILIDAEWPTLSPNGARVAYGNGGLWVARADGSHRRRIVNFQQRPVERQTSYQTWQPSWSGDGRRLAFAALWRPYLARRTRTSIGAW